MWLWDESIYDHRNRTGSLKFYNGDYHVDIIDIDVDYTGDDETTMNLVSSILFTLKEELEIPEYHILISFSGTGFNILIPASLFNFSPSPTLPAIVKETMIGLFPEGIDNIYDAGRIYRIMNTLNPKSELFKIPLTHQEFYKMSMEEIRGLAKSPRMDFEYDEDWTDAEPILEEYVREPVFHAPQAKGSKKGSRSAKCIEDLWGTIPKERNNAAMRIASHYRRVGVPEDASHILLSTWGEKVGLEPAEVAQANHHVYKEEYTYSCQDQLLKSHCSTDCVFYRGKNYGSESMAIKLLTVNEMKEKFITQLNTDYTGKMLDLAQQWGFPELDIELYPGQVIVVMGPTGAGKSALAQQICTHASDLNTVYCNLENGFEMMFRRNVQLVSGMSKDEVKNAYKNDAPDWERHFSHITYVDTYSMELNDIYDVVKAYAGQFQMLVVDHIKLVDGDYKDDFRKIGEITRGLKQIALENNIIIMEISQVSKDVSRNNTWDAMSGSGNGSIGHDADVVIAVTGDNTRPERTVRVLKNRDGDCTEFDAMMNHALRIEKLAPVMGGNNPW